MKFVKGDYVLFHMPIMGKFYDDRGIVLKGNYQSKKGNYVCRVKYDSGTIAETPIENLKKLSKLERALK